MRSTRWMFVAASAAIATTLWLPGEAAQPTPPASTAAAATGATGPAGTDGRTADTITFEQYRDWRLNQIERRRDDLSVQLAATDLPARQKARIEQIKAYYDWLAGLPEADRD